MGISAMQSNERKCDECSGDTELKTITDGPHTHMVLVCKNCGERQSD